MSKNTKIEVLLDKKFEKSVELDGPENTQKLASYESLLHWAVRLGSNDLKF